jgi:chemotaxis protein MotA
MFFIIGTVVVIACVITGYVLAGGHLHVLWQPLEFLIILGSGAGGFIIGNPKSVLAEMGRAMKSLMAGPQFDKNAYLELLCLQYSVLKLLKAKGALAIEPHLEDPHKSDLFQKFPKFIHNHHAVVFLCDYLRMVTMNADNPLHIETLMDIELSTHHAEDHRVAGAIQTVADALPALGIVAAVLGVIHTMGSITEPPEVLGHLIGAALVGTFFGVLVAYGFVAPMANAIKNTFELDSKYVECIRVGLLAHLNGFAPVISVEFARKSIPPYAQPSFLEVEQACNNL